MKRFLASLLAVLMLVSLLPLSAFADETTTATDAQEPAQIVSRQLVLGDNLSMRFWVKANMENAAINVTVGSGETKHIPLTEQDTTGNYVVNVALAAAQMTDVITLQAIAGDVTGTAQQCTVRQYAEEILTGNYGEATTDLVQAMLNYGAGAQIYFGYNNTPDQLANKGYESNVAVTLPEEQAIAVEGTTEGVRFYGASMSFRDRIALRYYFTGDISALTVHAGEKAYTVGQKDGLSYVELSDINPQDYATVYTVSVGDGDAPLSVGYSAMHYISRMGKRGNESLVNLLEKLYAYHSAAISYIGWLESCENLADYAVVYGDNATANEQTARDMIVEYIRRSTGVTLPMISASEATYTADAKYLVVGDTGLNGWTPASDLGYRGYQIKSCDSSVFVCGGTDYGTLCGAVGFLCEVVGLDAYGPQTVKYEKKSTIGLDNFDLTVVPDIGMEQPPFMLVSSSMWNQALWGVGQKSFGLIEGSSNHWHNSFDYIPPEEYYTAHPEYYVTAGSLLNKKPVQLSYTANGDAEAFDEMTTICADKIIAAAQKDPDMERITLTAEDNSNWDSSKAATTLYDKYGTHSAEVIIFLNAVADKVQAALGDRKLDIYFFAYYNTYAAPVKLVDGQYVAIDSEVEIRDNVGVMYAPISGDFTTGDYTSSKMYTELSGWAALTDNLAVWNYQTDFGNYFAFTNTFNSIAQIYKTMADYGVKYTYNQGQWNNGNSTGFSHLKTYLTGKLSWNADADMETLLDRYFTGRFGSAAEAMRSLFDDMRVSHDAMSANDFSMELIEKWLGYLDSAYASADNDTIKGYIDLESLAVRYLMISLYGDAMSTDDRMVMMQAFKQDCTALNITRFSEGKTIDYLWEQWDDATVQEIEGVYYNFDLSLGLTSYDVPVSASIGTVTAVYDNSYNALRGVTIGADSITFSEEAVNALLNGGSYGDFALYMTTADTIYKVNVAIVTKMISSYDDLQAVKANQVNGVLDGYYALANDIDATGEDAICLIDFAGYINNNANSGIGFKGIFDGRGHTVSNLTTKTNGYALVGGLFGQILQNAVIRDIAFMDITTDNAYKYTYLLTGESGRMMGTMENVVISAKGDVNQAFGVLGCDIANTDHWARFHMKNVIVSGVDYLAHTIKNADIFENIILVSDEGIVKQISASDEDEAATNSVIRFGTNEDLFTAMDEENVIADWEDSGIAYANTAIHFNGKAIITEKMSIAETEAVIGASTELTTEGSITLTLKETVDGVTLNGKTLTVDGRVKDLTKVVIVATSTVSGVTREYVIVLKRVYTDAQTDLTLDVLIGAESVKMTLPALQGNVDCLIYGDKISGAGLTVADGTLTVSGELLDEMYAELGYGEHTVYLGTDASMRYAVSLTFVTKFISNLEELRSIAVPGNTLDGYYVLSADIDCDDTHFTLLGTWTNTTSTGFVGTFDGRGHIIDGYNGGTSGLFYCFGNTAVVKNVAFTNTTGDTVLGGNENHGATFENIFVGGEAQYITKAAWDSPTYKNVLMNSTASDARLFNEGSNGTLTVTNVYNVGTRVRGYWGGTANETNARFFADVTALLEAFAAETAWDESSFTYTEGQILFNGKAVVQCDIDLRGETSIYRGTGQTYMTSDSDLYLKYEVDGVTLEFTSSEDEEDIYTLYVDPSVPVGTQIVIVAESWDYSAVTKELVVTVSSQYTDVDLTGEGSKADVELTGGATVVVPFAVEAISYGDSGMVMEGISYADGKLSLTKETVDAIVAEVGLGEKSLKLYSPDDNCYEIIVTLVTKVLKTQADLESIAVDGILDGYYVLAGDIVCDGTTLINLAGYASNAQSGFIGIFDGRGYSISNVNVGYRGLFYGLGAGTVKNLAVLHAVGTLNDQTRGGTLAFSAYGTTFENVFVSSNTKYLLQSAWDSPTFKNVVFISGDPAEGRIIYEGSTGTLTTQNVFLLGLKFGYWGATLNETNVKAFTTVDDLLLAIGADGELDKWSGSSFTFADGQLRFNGKVAISAPISLNGPATIIRGTSETFTSNGVISLKQDIDGVSLSNGVLSVAYDVPVDTVITLVAANANYPSITTQWNVQVTMVYREVDLTAEGSIGDLETAESVSLIKLPAAIKETIHGVSYGETVKYSSGISVTDGVLSIPKAWVTEIYNAYGYGEHNIILYSNADTSYTVTVSIVTKTIATLADLKSIAVSGNTLDGYYVLTADIGCDSTHFSLLGTWTNTTATGFVGTFDGRGHIIDGYNGSTVGLFYCMGASTVKNVAFTNTTGEVVLGSNEIHGTTFENILITGSNQYVVRKVWDSPTFKNVVMNSTATDARLFSEGSNGTLTVTNVYNVGTRVHGYWGSVANETNAQFFADPSALVEALGTEGALDENDPISVTNGQLQFGGKCLSYQEATWNTAYDMGDLQTTTVNSNVLPSGNVIAISVDGYGRMSAGVSCEDGILTLDPVAVSTIAMSHGYGEVTLKLYTDEGKFYTASACVVTKILTDQADLESIAVDGILDGYYVLASDIVCDGTTLINLAGYASNAQSGFIGTFDGRGYSISNVNVGYRGLFYGLGAGTVKNLAVFHAVGTLNDQTRGGTLAFSAYGTTFENVFVSSNTKYLLQSAWDSPTFKNVVFISGDPAEGRIIYEGSTGTLTTQNVFLLGLKFGYWGATLNETNVKAFTTADDLLAAIGADGELDKWSGSYFRSSDGKLYFNGRLAAE